MMINSIFKNYIRLVSLTAVFILSAVIIFNAIIDPYGLLPWPRIDGINTYKPSTFKRVRLLKAYDLWRIKPQSVLLGSSRSHLAFRTSHPDWAQQYSRRYNLAFDGATTKEMYTFLQHAHAVSPVKQILLGLDTYHLSHAPASTRPDFDSSILMNKNNPLSFPKILGSSLRILSSLDTLSDSMKTIRSQQTQEPNWFAKDGQRLGEVFFRRPSENFKKFGPRYYFEEIDTLEVGFKLEWRIPSPSQSIPGIKPSEQSTSMDYIKKIIAFCRNKNIDLKIFITPAHAHQMELDYAVGEWNTMENGKRELVNILNEDAKLYKDRLAIPFIDFSGYNSITSENLPDNDKDEMKHYWDSSHFKEQIGDLVLSRVLNINSNDQKIPADFGILLTAENIEQALKNIQTSQLSYRQSHPQDVHKIQLQVEEYKRKHNIKD